MIRFRLMSVMVNDQSRALDFYTGKLGFLAKHDIPMGPHRWLTVVSPAEPEGVEVLLEPNAHPAAPPFQQGLRESGVPIAAFEVDDIAAEYARLKGLGVAFKGEPMAMGPVTIAILDDTCGNWIQLYQLMAR